MLPASLLTHWSERPAYSRGPAPSSSANLAFVQVNVTCNHALIRSKHAHQGECIKLVAPSRRTAVPVSAHVVPGSGQVSHPRPLGYAVHALHKHRVSTFLPLFVATGVTGIGDA